MTRYLNLAEFFGFAEQITGLDAAILVKASRTDLALHARAAGFGDEDFYPDLSTRRRYLPAGSRGTVHFRTATSALRGRAW